MQQHPLVQVIVQGSTLLALDTGGRLWVTTSDPVSGDVKWREVRQTFVSRGDQHDAVRRLEDLR